MTPQERISGTRGCDIVSNGAAYTDNIIYALTARADGTTISAATLLKGEQEVALSKNYLDTVLNEGELIVFEFPVVSLTLSAGTAMCYFEK